MKFYVLVIFSFAFCFSFSQNKMENGLRTGFWVYHFNLVNDKFKQEGKYIIANKDDYDSSFKRENSNTYKLKYKNSIAYIICNYENESKLSLKDSLWKVYNNNNIVIQETSYSKGIENWSKSFDSNGSLTVHFQKDYYNDITSYFYYKNDRIFKTEKYLPADKNHAQIEYYPNDNLKINNAELDFKIDFINKKSDTAIIEFSAKKKLAITGINSENKFARFLNAENNKPLSFPMQLKVDKKYAIKVIISPTPANYISSDVINITTSVDKLPYKIYSDINGYHLDFSSVQNTDTVILSKSKDRFLVIPNMGTQTDVWIKFMDYEMLHQRILGNTRIDISNFVDGIYDLIITACETGGNCKLKIVQ